MTRPASPIPAPALGTRHLQENHAADADLQCVIIDKAANAAGILVTVRNGVGTHIERELIARELGKLGLDPEQVCLDVELDSATERRI